MIRRLAPVLGIALIVLVLWMVGWNDRVWGSKEVVHKGRIVERTEGAVVLEVDGKQQTYRTPHKVEEGLRTVFSRLSTGWHIALAGVAVHLLAFLVMYVRWGVLLKGADLATPWRTVVRLGWVGHFFGAVLPGGVPAGDVVKAVYVSRTHHARKTRAVVTVFVDRMAGLSMLGFIAAVAVLTVESLGTVRLVVLGLFGVMALGILLVFSRRFRNTFRLNKVIWKLPFHGILKEAAEAVEIYGRKRGLLAGVFALAIVSHLLLLSTAALYGDALGDPIPLLGIFACLPVALIISSVPGLPGGWGVGELAFLTMLGVVGVPAAQAVALSVTWRTLHTLLCLPAAFMLGHGKERIRVPDGSEESEEHAEDEEEEKKEANVIDDDGGEA